MRIGSTRKPKVAERREPFEVRHDPVWDLPVEIPSAVESHDTGRLATVEAELRRALEGQAELARRVEQLETLIRDLGANGPATVAAPATTRKRTGTATATSKTAPSATTGRRSSTKKAVGE